jgi:Zn finger protein HypA/HybF involved in hydrogenase expression
MFIKLKDNDYEYHCPHCGYIKIDIHITSWLCPKCYSYNYEVIECSHIEKPNV